MAVRVSTETVSDLSGDAGASTVRIQVGDRVVDVDLTDAEVADLQDRFADVFGVGRKPGKPSPRTSGANKSAAADYPQYTVGEVREWAEKTGLLPPGSRGRIGRPVWEQYDQYRITGGKTRR